MTRRENQGHSAIIAEIIGKPATEFPSRAFSIGNPAELGENVDARSSLTPQFWSAVPSRHIRGNRDEDAAGSRPDCRVSHFIRSQGPGARRRCCARRSVGSRGLGTRGRSRGCVYRLFGRAFDCAFVGNTALCIIIAASPTRGAERLDHTSVGECEFAAARQSGRVASRQAGRAAAGSGA